MSAPRQVDSAPTRRLTATPALRVAAGIAMGVAAVVATAALKPYLGNSVYFGATFSTALALLTLGGFWPTFVAGIIPTVSTLYPAAVDGAAGLGRGDLVKSVIFALGITVVAWFDGRARRERARLRQREQEVGDSEWRYRMLIEQASDAILVFTPEMRVEIASLRAAELLGRDRQALIGCTYAELFADDGDVIRRLVGRRGPAEDTPELVEHTVPRPDGSSITGELSAQGLIDGRVQVIIRDVTSRLRVVAEVRRERDLLDGILETSGNAIIATEVPSQRLLFANQRMEALTGATHDELMARGLDGIGWEYAEPDGSPLAPERLPARRVLQAGRPLLNETVCARTPGQPWRLLSFSGAPLTTAAGSVNALVLSFEDITVRAASERSLVASEERLRRITDAIPGIVYQYLRTPAGEQHFQFVSAGVQDLMHLSAGTVLDDFSEFVNRVIPEDRERLARSVRESMRTLTRWTEEFQLELEDGDRKWIRGSAVPEPPLADGSVRWNGILLNITERKRLEADLLQVQKMESIGRLAGGIAHDFNNILTAIRGNVDLLLDEVPEGHEHFHELRDIRDAAERATALTRQLLAFSRKQAMETRDLDLGVLVRDMEKMLRRVIGEDVVLLTQPTDSSGVVRADPGQLEQVLLNLAVNARDAMPSGGLLTIETRNVRMDAATAGALDLAAGDYVSLVVRDTGHGMTEATKSRIFDPFFTTKPAGKGTGLGLAMVYGIVRQSGGGIAVESEPERGATFRLYFPRASGMVPRASPVITPTGGALALRREATVLLVEDDAAVRSLTRRMLTEAGYTVREAGDAYEALTMVGPECAGIDVVVSDVIMPGMGGRDLASELRARRRDLRIMFISGYLDIDIQRLGLDRQTQLLAKPFNREGLLRGIAELLDRKAKPAVEA